MHAFCSLFDYLLRNNSFFFVHRPFFLALLRTLTFNHFFLRVLFIFLYLFIACLFMRVSQGILFHIQKKMNEEETVILGWRKKVKYTVYPIKCEKIYGFCRMLSLLVDFFSIIHHFQQLTANLFVCFCRCVCFFTFSRKKAKLFIITFNMAFILLPFALYRLNSFHDNKKKKWKRKKLMHACVCTCENVRF